MSEKTKEILNNLKEIRSPSVPEPIIKPVSNIYGEDQNGKPIYIDRIYGGIYGQTKLINKNGTTYKGKIHKRSILVKGMDGNNFRSHTYETDDGRWFDRSGMPIEKPKSLVKEEPKEETTIEVIKTELTPEEKLANEQAFLKKLK